MKIDKNTTLKIAKLSRLRIEENEIEELSSQLSSILEWVEQLNEINTNNVEALSNVSMAKLPLRQDKENNEVWFTHFIHNSPVILIYNLV